MHWTFSSKILMQILIKYELTMQKVQLSDATVTLKLCKGNNKWYLIGTSM